MKKTIWIIIFLCLAIIIGFFVGMYLYNKEDNYNKLENNEEQIMYNNITNNINTLEIETSTSEEKISINTEVIEEIYYTQCDHLIKNKKKSISNLINMTKDDLIEEYPNWEIKEFSKERVVLYKEEQGFCNEHYLVKDVDGLVTIYNMDNNDKVAALAAFEIKEDDK